MENTTISGNMTSETVITPQNLTEALAKPNNITEYQQLGTETSSFSWANYMNALVVVFVMLFALYGGLWLLRKYGKGKIIPSQPGFKREHLKVEAQLGIGPKKQLLVVRYFHKRLLLGITEQNISLLSEEYLENFEKTDKLDKTEKPAAFEKFIADIQNSSSNTNQA